MDQNPAPREQNSTLTDLLLAHCDGDAAASEKLWEIVYSELRVMARRYLAGERKNHTLQATALVHEAYLRLIDQHRSGWRNRNQFLAIAAKMMRRVLVDYARARGRAKRGGDATVLSLDLISDVPEDSSAEITVVDEALREFETMDPFKASVVELRFFGGMTHAEIAHVLECSEATVRRHWVVAKAWLQVEIEGRCRGS